MLKPNLSVLSFHRALLLTLLAATVLGGCAEKKSDEEQIQTVLLDGAKAIEENRISAAADALAENYLDPSKRDKLTMKRTAVFLRRRGPIGLFLRDFDIKIGDAETPPKSPVPDGTTAQVDFDVFAVQGKASVKTAADVIPDRAKKLTVKAQMRKVGGDWQVTSIEGDKMGASTMF